MRRFASDHGPLVATVALIVLLASWHAFMLPLGVFQHDDEYLTLDRASSFLRHGDWLSVFGNNAPNFKKPPLQYWATAALLEVGSDLEFAVRLPSFIFGIGMLGATAWLARLMMPKNPWVMPTSTLLLAGSLRFWQLSLSGLLDCGAAFFATVALAGALTALRHPRFWWLVAVACGIGSLQKAPTPFLFAAMPAIGLAFGGGAVAGSWRDSLGTRSFRGAVMLAVVLAALWPALQWMRHGAPFLHEAYVQQMLLRFSPFEAAIPVQRRSLFSLLTDGEPALRLMGLFALFSTPFLPGGKRLLGLPLLVGTYALVTSFATGIVSPRYSLLFLPMTMASLATACLNISVPPVGRIALVMLAMAVGQGPIKTPAALELQREGEVARLIPLFKSAGASVQADETLIYCRRPGNGLHIGALAYFSKVERPWVPLADLGRLDWDEIARTMRPPFRGLCDEREFEILAPRLVDLTVVERSGGYVHWTAGALRP